MSASYLVIYEGRPDDADAFFDYYVTKHVPLIWGFPRIRAVEIMREVGDSELFMITRLVFDTVEELRQAVTSPYRSVTKADMDKFPAFRGTIRWEIVENLDFTPPED